MPMNTGYKECSVNEVAMGAWVFDLAKARAWLKPSAWLVKIVSYDSLIHFVHRALIHFVCINNI